MCILRILLHAITAADILHPRVGLGSWLSLGNTTSSSSSAGISALPGSHVRRPGLFFHRSRPPRDRKVWLGDADVADEL
jgi:hypothetical protein